MKSFIGILSQNYPLSPLRILSPVLKPKPLKLCYPALYTIARFPDAWVVDNLSVVGGVVH
jgi:hypothetical protein